MPLLRTTSVTGNVISNPTTNRCYRYGRDTHLANSADCPAKSANCKACGKTGHFKLMCRSALPNGKSVPKDKTKRDSVHQVTENQTQYDVFATMESASKLVTREMLIEGVKTDICVDTGAEVNTMPANLIPGLKLRHMNMAWGNFDIPVLGEVDCIVEYKAIKTGATFVVT